MVKNLVDHRCQLELWHILLSPNDMSLIETAEAMHTKLNSHNGRAYKKN